MTFKNCQLKIKEGLNLIAERMQRFFEPIFAYYDLLLPIGLDGITKRHKMCLNYPQCGHKERGKFPFFGEITIKASTKSMNKQVFTANLPMLKLVKF